MGIQKVVQPQRDFSNGECDPWIKRSDDQPTLKGALRQASNWRVLSSRALANRPGRRLLMREASRVDEVIMLPGNNFYLVFGETYLRVYNAALALVFDSGGGTLPWTAATVKTIVWDYYKLDIFICFDGMQPRVLTWDGVSQSSTWTLTTYTPRTGSSGQKRTAFYRLSPVNVGMRPSAEVGAVTIPFTAGMNLVSGQVGTRMRFANRQLTIDTVVNATNATGTVNEHLFNGFSGSTSGLSDLRVNFSIDDEIIGQTSGAKAIISSFSADGTVVFAQSINANSFSTPETFVGPNGSASISTVAAAGILVSTVWDDEVMNAFRGWPRSCFVDQGRLGFCDFPALPGLIVWSAVGDFYDLYTDAANVGPTNAIQELVPGKSRVLYVVPGAEGSEFVFCDNAVYYIPINATNPLKPGSVAFNTLMSEGVAQVQPRPVQQSIVYVSAGNTQLKAVQAIGAYNRPYIVDDISTLHSHLLGTPICIAAPGGSDQFEESYFYVGKSDGSLVVCNFSIKNGIIDVPSIGMLPWSGNGSATWIAALKGHSDVIVTASYNAGSVALVEQVDLNYYLDVAMFYNVAQPVNLQPPVGKGPLWYLAGATADLWDSGRPMGTYQIDANGFLVPQFNAGENLTSATLIVGQAWTAIAEPFVPAVQGGQDVGQRLKPRRVMRFEVYVYQSSGFTICRLFGGPPTRTSPAIGTVMQRRRWPAWNQDDDPTQAPPLREQTEFTRPLGRTHDPRNAVIKDTPGPLTIMEILQEVTV